jgi:2-polyprenyl-6-methoxyphenol hydroxylase-like FAD-dependent oxidoreductase
MTKTRTDILISGGGIAGLTAAAAFARDGFSVILADPALPAADAQTDGSDLRSTAFLAPAIALLREAGLWDALALHAARLDTLRVVDTTGWPPEIRDERAFRAEDVTDGPFGWNLPNWLTRKVLAKTLSGSSNVDLRLGTGFASMLTRESGAIVRLTDGSRIEARLVVGADGRASPVREAAGISVSTSPATGRRRWPSRSRTPTRTTTPRPSFTTKAAPSCSCRCPTTRAAPLRPWCGWSGGRAPSNWRRWMRGRWRGWPPNAVAASLGSLNWPVLSGSGRSSRRWPNG